MIRSHSIPRWGRLLLLALALFGFFSFAAHAQSATPIVPFKLNLGVESAQNPKDVDVGIKVLFAITLLTLAPSIILLMTSFTRIVIVLSFVRSALSLQGTPANQIIIGLSLFMTYFIMDPVWKKIDNNALQPYMASQINSEQAMAEASKPIRA